MEKQTPGRGLVPVLGLLDVVLMTVVGVVALRWVARAARMGAASITLWALAWLVFFLPLAFVVSELVSRYPDEGGLYAWTRRAFGPFHGFLCGWCLWVNNLVYFPSLLLFGAANAALATGAGGAALSADRPYLVASVLAGLVAVVLLNVAGWSRARWVQNVGSVGTWLPAFVLIGCGAFALATTGSATSFTPRTLVPAGDTLATLSLWSAICFAFSGFELTALVGQEVRDPSRTIPLGVLLAGALVTVIYVAGSASILIVVPAGSLAELSGIVDAIDLVARRMGLPGVAPLIAALLAVSAFAMTSSWFAGAARVPFAAGVDEALPGAFGRLHPRFRTPHVALVVQGVAAAVIFVLSVALEVSGARPSIQDAYDVLVNLTILLYFVPYVYLFLAFARLRRDVSPPGPSARSVVLPAPTVPPAPRTAGGFRVPGGRAGAWLAAGSGLAATAVSLALLFVPPAGTTSVLYFEASLVGQAALLVGAGLVLYRRSRRRLTG